MSLFERPSVFLAIIFGCFVLLIPRVFLPYFRPRPSYHIDDHFRRSQSSMSHHDHDDIIEPIPDSSSHMHNTYPNMRIHHPDINNQIDQTSSRPTTTLALPMYTVGIIVFLIYTCFKYFTKRNSQENKIRHRYSSNNIQWNAQKKKFNYHVNNHQNEINNDEENEEDLYAGLDPDYVEYLKLKRQKEEEREQAMATEQRQMHHTLDDMKNSLSFINSKLGTNTKKINLTNNEILQLQERLASTEAQMYKILNALDAASNKMNEITKNSRETLEQPHQTYNREEDDQISLSESEDDLNEEEEEENSNSEDENSFHQKTQVLLNNKQEAEKEDEGSSSFEEEDEVSNEAEEEDDESESESDRYGIMNTNYGCDPTTIDDYDLDDGIKKPEETTDSQAKVQEWHQRNHSQSLSSNNSSIEGEEEEGQSIPNEEENQLRRRKREKQK